MAVADSRQAEYPSARRRLFGECRLNPLGMNLTPVAAEYGRASAMKLSRSIVMKAIEAAMIEMTAAALAWGVEREVIVSQQQTYPGIRDAGGRRHAAGARYRSGTVPGDRRYAATQRQVMTTGGRRAMTTGSAKR
jgi:3-hydroxyisobutyrate dehydrogenase-like beta-hydroxyacid dehydrogenase